MRSPSSLDLDLPLAVQPMAPRPRRAEGKAVAKMARKRAEARVTRTSARTVKAATRARVATRARATRRAVETLSSGDGALDGRVHCIVELS